MLVGQLAAGLEEFVRAEQRDGRGEVEAHLGRVEGPPDQRLLADLDDLRRLQRADAPRPVGVGPVHGVDQAGDRPIEGDVGQHRRDDGAHAGILIGLPDRDEAVDGDVRDLGEQVVAGGAAAPDHFRRADGRRQVLVLGRAVAAHPGAAVEEQFERPPVAVRLGEVALRMGVRIDQAGNDDPVRCGNPRDALADRESRSHLDDLAVANEDIGARRCLAGIDKNQAAFHQGETAFDICHRV